jgi:hypothetical protein
MITKLFPVLLIILSYLSAIVYLCHKDYNKTIYWICAGTLTLMVTIK